MQILPTKLWLLGFVSFACTGLTLAQESAESDHYAVATAVFPQGSAKPVLTAVTVFEGRRAYDAVQGSPPQWACFDFDEQRVVVLQPQKKEQAVIPFTDILQFQSELRLRATKRGGLANFLADPTFIHEFDANKSTIKLSSPWLVYEANVHSAAFDHVERFVSFADWSARVSGLLHPAAPPASARLELNRALKKQNWLPTRITRSSGPRSQVLGVVRSEHTYRTKLTDEDVRLTGDIKKALQEFDLVSFSEYRRSQNPPTKLTKK